MLTSLQPDLPINPQAPSPLAGAGNSSATAKISRLESQVSFLTDQCTRLNAALRAMWDTLNRDGALTISNASMEGSFITATNGIKFPATQSPQTDPNTLDDYEEDSTGTNLSITFATPGNLSVAYTLRKIFYVKIGTMVFCDFAIITSAFTHTTASGDLQITGFPFTSASTTNRFWSGAISQFEGITKAGFTQFGLRLGANTTTGLVLAGGSGAASASVQAADMPSGGTVVLIGSLAYSVT